MDYYFFDSSAIVKNYISETGTAWVKEIFNAVETKILYAGAISQVEVISAFARRLRGGSLTDSEAFNAAEHFKFDFEKDFRIIEVESFLLNRAVRLAEKYALRGYDAVQLAAALEVFTKLVNLKINVGEADFTFISADNELNSAAQNEGLTVENPNDYP